MLSEARLTPDATGNNLFGTPIVMRTRSESECYDNRHSDKLLQSFNMDLMHEGIEPNKMATSHSAINLTADEFTRNHSPSSPGSLKVLSPMQLRADSRGTESPKSPLSNDMSPTTSIPSGKYS